MRIKPTASGGRLATVASGACLLGLAVLGLGACAAPSESASGNAEAPTLTPTPSQTLPPTPSSTWTPSGTRMTPTPKASGPMFNRVLNAFWQTADISALCEIADGLGMAAVTESHIFLKRTKQAAEDYDLDTEALRDAFKDKIARAC